MIKIENVDVYGWEAAIRGARNPMNSWDKSDSDYRPILCATCDSCQSFFDEKWQDCDDCDIAKTIDNAPAGFMVGPNDKKLLQNLANAGPDHGKFLRFITVSLDITAPLYWWKEFDTYKVGTVANSCSTMHKIHAKEFALEDFSCEHMTTSLGETFESLDVLTVAIDCLNKFRRFYLETHDKRYWWQLIQLLPTSYNQRRTVLLNYQVLKTMYHARKHHKLDEWRNFCEWIRTLPYSELIIDG
jgi:hypothetical protein